MECEDRHIWLSWFDPGDPALRKRWKLMVSSHPTNSKLPGYKRFSLYTLYMAFSYMIYTVFSLYMVSVPACAVTLTSPESILPMPHTSPKDARNCSAATAGCFEACFKICWYVYITAVNAIKKCAYWQSGHIPSWTSVHTLSKVCTRVHTVHVWHTAATAV